MQLNEHTNTAPPMPADFEQVFTSSQEQLKAALEKSGEVLRFAMSTALQSVRERLNLEAGNPSRQDLLRPVDMRLQIITADAVHQAFERAKDMLGEIERASAEGRASPYTPPSSLPAPETLAGPMPADPLAATEFLMSEATQSLAAAMQSVIVAMTRHPSGSEREA